VIKRWLVEGLIVQGEGYGENEVVEGLIVKGEGYGENEVVEGLIVQGEEYVLGARLPAYVNVVINK